MTKYRYEFKDSDFEPGNCPECPLGYLTSDSYGYNKVECVLGHLGIDCPLEEVEDD